MGLKDKCDAAASMAGSWPGANTMTTGDSSSPPSPATFLTVNANIKRNPSLKKLLKLPIFGGGGGGKFLVNILNYYVLVFICVFCMSEMGYRRMAPLSPSPFSMMMRMIQKHGLARKLCVDRPAVMDLVDFRCLQDKNPNVLREDTKNKYAGSETQK